MEHKASPADPVWALSRHVQSLLSQAENLHADSASPQEMARAYIKLRKLADQISEEIWNPLREMRDKLAYEWVPEAFEMTGTKNVRLEEGYRVGVQALVRASTKDMEKGIKWMDENGMAEIPKRTINASTLAAVARDMATRNQELPEDIFNVTFGQNTSVTRL